MPEVSSPSVGDHTYPVSVTCRICHTTVEYDYVITGHADRERQDKIAREYLAGREGWSCTQAGDYCPTCEGGV